MSVPKSKSNSIFHPPQIGFLFRKPVTPRVSVSGRYPKFQRCPGVKAQAIESLDEREWRVSQPYLRNVSKAHTAFVTQADYAPSKKLNVPGTEEITRTQGGL